MPGSATRAISDRATALRSWPTWTGRRPGPTGWESTGCTSISRERERDGIVDPGREREELSRELATRLEAVRDVDGRRVIRRVYRADKVYSGSATRLAPDLVVGYNRGYRASWATCLGGLTDAVLLDNDSAWSADHCADAGQLPGVLFSNRPIAGRRPLAGQRGAVDPGRVRRADAGVDGRARVFFAEKSARIVGCVKRTFRDMAKIKIDGGLLERATRPARGGRV